MYLHTQRGGPVGWSLSGILFVSFRMFFFLLGGGASENGVGYIHTYMGRIALRLESGRCGVHEKVFFLSSFK